ncbi:hypothetical protein [Sphingomonas turrisvirgatae]|uniref:Uncharacterized protein n=1 Tax=Sphingomonas turrisvirgatae TaxID=1888892 RepID=A0A1E3LX04_9SPHN|nr:hypothetical protein [Sphingomonas turrisvirgatae]ODP38249.1 hypothetical protein BFL28_14830 [Sphingomonas turrisvirgatae]
MRVLVEALYVAAGIAVALVFASLCAWAYPLAKQDVWLVTGVAIVCVILMAIGPMRRAAALDRARREERRNG